MTVARLAAPRGLHAPAPAEAGSRSRFCPTGSLSLTSVLRCHNSSRIRLHSFARGVVELEEYVRNFAEPFGAVAPNWADAPGPIHGVCVWRSDWDRTLPAGPARASLPETCTFGLLCGFTLAYAAAGVASRKSRPMRMFSGYRDCISRACAMAAFAAVVAAAAVPGWAQTYPSQPVELVVGYPQSGAGDIIARLIADRLGNVLGQPVHAENRPGASGAIAAQTVAHAAPDGHTLLAGQTPEVAIIPTLVEMPRHRSQTRLTHVTFEGAGPGTGGPYGRPRGLLLFPASGGNAVRDLGEAEEVGAILGEALLGDAQCADGHGRDERKGLRCHELGWYLCAARYIETDRYAAQSRDESNSGGTEYQRAAGE